MKFRYTKHFLIRAKNRDIPKIYAPKIFKESQRKYYDILSQRHIAIAHIYLRNKARNIVVAYDIIGEEIEFVTIHEIRAKEIDNKINSGRWVIYEETN